MDDPGRMEELLGINDQITTLLRELPPPSRPVLTLHGLGLNFNNAPSVGVTQMNGIPNGHSPETLPEEPHDDPELTPTTPRIDKGKGRAEPEPEEPEKVLSPTLLESESEDEEEEEEENGSLFVPVEELEGVASPTDR